MRVRRPLLLSRHAPGTAFGLGRCHACHAGGITVQPGLQKITDGLVRVTPYVHHSKEHIVVFFGALSNLDDLLRRSQEFRRGGSSLQLGRAAGAGALTGELLLMLYKRFGEGEELILLSELQVGWGRVCVVG